MTVAPPYGVTLRGIGRAALCLLVSSTAVGMICFRVRADARSESTGARIVHADEAPQNWLTTGRNYQETRYSPLDQITPLNVSKLGLAWSYRLDTDRGQEATPLAVDGIVYTTSAWSKVEALDGVSGKLLWQFDPHVPGATAVKACCDVVNRGAAYWNGKIYVGTLDGRLIAIDAHSGAQLWSTVTVDQSRNYTITGAPRVVKGLVLIGNGGSEYDVRGYLSAYDAKTGALAWRFYTVPGKPGQPDHAASDDVLARLANPTWSADTWSLTHGAGGGTVWDAITYDPDLDLLYFGVGNGDFWPQKFRSPSGGRAGNNDNLFVASIVAVRPETGRYVWHYQDVPGDQWDYDATQQITLADIKIGGRVRKVLLQAGKDGFFYVIDRANGRLISADPFTKVNWATKVDPATGRPAVVPAADYSTTGKAWMGMPGPRGGHNWHPMSFDPGTGLVYLPTQANGFLYAIDPSFRPLPVGYDFGVDMAASRLPIDPATLAKVRLGEEGYLTAWDPVARKAAWQIRQPTAVNGGVLSSGGGLVFEGGSPGLFSAYDASNGHKLWSFDAQSGIIAAPITWSLKGRQYVTVLAGWGSTEGLGLGPINWSSAGPRRNISRVLTFALGGMASLATLPPEPGRKLDPPSQLADAARIEQGAKLYANSCGGCHGPSAVGGGIVPDLRYSHALADEALWNSVLVDGALAGNGMVSFKPDYTEDQLNAIRAYIIDEAQLSVRYHTP